MRERRTERRLLCADMASIEWCDPNGQRRVAHGLLEDISGPGACLQMEAGMAEETKVLLHYGDWEIPASVSYCEFREIGWFIGIVFEAGFEWTRDQFVPEHLFDVAQLVS